MSDPGDVVEDFASMATLGLSDAASAAGQEVRKAMTPDIPEPPATPEAPQRGDPAAQEAAARERRQNARRARQRGSGTLLTSPLGVVGNVNVATRRLLGG